MKKTHPLLSFLGLAAAAAVALPAAIFADDDHKDHDHDHDHEKKMAGPNGGRVIMSVEPHVEFLVQKDGTVKITPLDDHNKPIALSGQSARLTGGDRTNPTRMNFAAKDGALVSDTAFPEGNDFPVVLQLKASEDAESVVEKFQLNLKDCPTCDFNEYACICDHEHDHDHDHKHEEKK